MIYENMNWTDYVKVEGINASLLKPFSVSDRHGKYSIEKPFTESKAMNIGSVVHSYVLEGEKAMLNMLKQDYILDGFPVNPATGEPYGFESKKFKDWRESQDKYKNVLLPADLVQALNIAKSVNSNEIAAGLLKQCKKREAVITWEHHGIKCKAMVDFFGDTMAGDLKTMAKSPTKRNIEYTIKDYQYSLQFAFYYDGLIANGLDIESFYGIFAQSSNELDCTVMRINQETLDYGRVQYELAIESYLRAKDKPVQNCAGLYDEIIDGGLPSFMLMQDEDDFINEIMEMN